MRRIETVIIGAGQAGLGTSYFLKQHGREHVVLEQAAVPGNVWVNQRWDSFTLVTPNWAFRLPGAEYDEDDPHAFMPREKVVENFKSYVSRYQLPVQYNTRVIGVESLDGRGYRVQTAESTIRADHVVIATGFFQKPKIPASAKALSPEITQLPSTQYRNPRSLPAGAVLVVGSGQTGCQIAEELYKSGRKVFLCTGGAGRAPRRYRGKDIIEWLELSGFFNRTPDMLPPGMGKFKGIPHLSGANGGHTLNLHQFARDGVALLGHFAGASDFNIFAAPDLYENLTIADQFELEGCKMIDEFIEAKGLNSPPEVLPQLRDGFRQPIIEALDCRSSGISTVIWAMGYSFDYNFIRLPVRDADGFPIQNHGVANHPGLYFVGIPWMPSEKSGSLFGFGEICKHVASSIAGDAERQLSQGT